MYPSDVLVLERTVQRVSTAFAGIYFFLDSCVFYTFFTLPGNLKNERCDSLLILIFNFFDCSYQILTDFMSDQFLAGFARK